MNIIPTLIKWNSKIITIISLMASTQALAENLCLKHYTLTNEASNSFYSMPTGLLAESKELKLATLANIINYYLKMHLKFPTYYRIDPRIFSPSAQAIKHSQLILALPKSKIDDYLDAHFQQQVFYKGSVEDHVTLGTKNIEDLKSAVKSFVLSEKSDSNLKSVINFFTYNELLAFLGFLESNESRQFLVTIKWIESGIAKSLTSKGVPKFDYHNVTAIDSLKRAPFTVPYKSIERIEVEELNEI